MALASEHDFSDLKNHVDRIFDNVRKLETKLKQAEEIKARIRDLEVSTLPYSEQKIITTNIRIIADKRRSLAARIKTVESEMGRLKSRLEFANIQWSRLYDLVNNFQVKIMEEGKSKLEKHETSRTEIAKLSRDQDPILKNFFCHNTESE